MVEIDIRIANISSYLKKIILFIYLNVYNLFVEMNYCLKLFPFC